MRRDLSAPITPAPWPHDVTRIPFDRAVAPACRDLMDEVYAETYLDDVTFEQWWAWLTTDAEYDPQVIYVASDGARIVGFLHGWSRPFIKDLVVKRDWRGRGLGAALVTSALEDYRNRGEAFVDLKTDVVNLTAQSVYQRLGFVVVEQIG